MQSTARKGMLVSLTLLTFASSAQAATIIDASSPSAIAEAARGFGSASIETDNTGDPKITGRIDGNRYGIFFYGCSSGKNCKSVQFYAGWAGQKVSLAAINEWNKSKRYGRAYLDKDNDPMLEMDVNLHGGVTRDNLDNTIDNWATLVKTFKSQVIQ